MRWYAILFWLWFLVSIVALVVRRTGRSARSAEPASSTSDTRTDLGPRSWPPPPPDPDGRPDPVDRPDPDGGVDDVPTAEPGAEPVPGPVGTNGHTSGAGPASLPELLAGIVLPHDLVPVTQGAAVDLATHAVFATDRAGGRDVREALVDELGRLGFEVVPTDVNSFTASNERGQVTVVVHPSPASEVEAGAPRFPTVSAGSVVVELRAL